MSLSEVFKLDHVVNISYFDTISNCLEFPLTIMAVDVRNENACHICKVAIDVVSNQLFLCVKVINMHEAIFDLAEVLPFGKGAVDVDDDRESFDIGRNFVEPDVDLLVISVTCSGEVVTVMLD